MKKLLTLCLLSLLAALQLSAQTPTSRLKPANDELSVQIAKQIGLFFTNIQNNNTRHAYEELFKGTRQAANADLLNDLVTMTENTVSKYGNIESFEALDLTDYGTHLIDVSFLTRHKDKFYRWQFIYQSASANDWRLVNMAVDDMRAYLPSKPINLPPPPYIQIKMEKFFLSLQNHAVETAFSDIAKGSLIENSGEQLNAFTAKTNLALSNYGAMKYYELIDNRTLGKSLRLLTYFNTLEKQTLRWQFIFTVDKDDKWTLLTIRVDDQIDAGIINSN